MSLNFFLYLANIWLLKVNNKNNRKRYNKNAGKRYEICLKLTVQKPELSQ